MRSIGLILLLPALFFTRSDLTQLSMSSTGFVDFNASWTVVEPSSTDAAWTTDGGLTNSVYNANELEILDFLKITDLDCNTKFEIKVTRSAWTVPADYMTAGAKKNSAGSTAGADNDSDILIKAVVNAHGYDETEGLVSSISSYTALNSTTPTQIFTGGEVGSGLHGVTNAQGDIDVKILMDWVHDIVGLYSISLTIDIIEVTS